MKSLMEFYNATHPLKEEQILSLYKNFNLKVEKIEIMSDFVDSLLHLVNETFLGKDVMDTNEIFKNHYKWCWNRVCKQFEKEKINILGLNSEFFNYFWYEIYERFYINDKKEMDFDIERKHYRKLLSLGKETSRNDMDKIVELFAMFEKIIK